MRRKRALVQTEAGPRSSEDNKLKNKKKTTKNTRYNQHRRRRRDRKISNWKVSTTSAKVAATCVIDIHSQLSASKVFVLERCDFKAVCGLSCHSVLYRSSEYNVTTYEWKCPVESYNCLILSQQGVLNALLLVEMWDVSRLFPFKRRLRRV